MKIVFGITVSNEIDEIKRLISFLQENKLKDHEIVVLADDLTVTKEVLDYLIEEKIPHYAKKLNNDFGEFKTALNVICKDIHEADYIFQIDADEVPTETLVRNIETILEYNPNIDAFLVPRINTLNVYDEDLIKQWQWVYDKKTGYINFPDYQGRVYKSHLKWLGKVHEHLNYETYAFLPKEEKFCLRHHKTIDKQIKQNNFYKTL